MPEKFVQKTCSGIELSIERFGHDGPATIVLISGAGAPAAFWPDFFCERLVTGGFDIIRFDHRDTGASTHLDAPYPIDELVSDVNEVISLAGESDIHLVGHSMGGYLVALVLSEAPSPNIRSGTAMAAGPTIVPDHYGEFGMSQPTEETWEKLMKNEPTGDLEKDWPGWLESWRFLNGGRHFEEELARGYTEALYSGDPRNAQVATNHIHAMSTVPANLPERLGSILTPTLVLHGTDDPLVPLDNGKALAQLIPGAKLSPLPEAGHMYYSKETWDEIAREIVGHVLQRGNDQLDQQEQS